MDVGQLNRLNHVVKVEMTEEEDLRAYRTHLHTCWKMKLKMQKKGEAKLMEIRRVNPHRKLWLIDGNSGQKKMFAEESDDAAPSERTAGDCRRA